MITKLIKKFMFIDDDREFIELSDIDKIRINTEDILSRRLQLKIAGAEFPLDDDIYAKTKITEPMAVKKWLGFEIVGNKPDGTDWLFKIDNDVNEYYHNGSDWIIANATDWNTESEFNNALSSYDFLDDTKKIRLVVKLKTTDKKNTPYIEQIKLLGEYDIDFYSDIIFDTVVNKMRTLLFFTSELIVPISPSTNLIDLSTDYKIENEGYNIDDIESVYDLVVDPLMKNNLYQSYAKGSQRKDGTYEPGIITLLQMVPDTNEIKIRFIAIPEVAVNTNQDYYELRKMPGIVFERISFEPVMGDQIQFEQDSVKDKENGTAVLLQPPAQNNIRFEYSVFTFLQLDLQNLTQSIRQFLNNLNFFTSYGLDESYPVRTVSPKRFEQKPDLDDVNTSDGVFEVLNVLFFLRQAEDVPLVKKMNLSFTTEEN